jgi:hypothetical protein
VAQFLSKELHIGSLDECPLTEYPLQRSVEFNLNGRVLGR